ncbi:glutamine amidotransferase [Capsulimonas corticalis]|uniref:Glutamine amidotransferase n=1 Tax=Capsulimonas corticalis TaxID=2219043 RepID=A0A402CPQ9_9BACT|nr:amidophosphoribosyltransferase [Capsulimonas corticalis]BDI32957.1 glutamine amidotransferase [Capsulimonas corticalis]
MCGIAGILYRTPKAYYQPVGHTLLAMATCLQHRGSDSAGIAVYAKAERQAWLQVSWPAGAALPEPREILAAGGGLLSQLQPETGGFRAVVSAMEPDAVGALTAGLEQQFPGATAIAFGKSLCIHKTVGLAEKLGEDAEDMTGTHGIAHLRLATESRIDPAHAQPFWGRPYPDIAVTHNGHITNYYKLRKRMEARGFSFASQNDSEIIGMVIGEKLAAGMGLEDALYETREVLDGSFSFLVATTDGIGVLRDPIATKPLLYVETDDMVALASEHQALHRVMGNGAKVREIVAREVRVWSRA